MKPLDAALMGLMRQIADGDAAAVKKALAGSPLMAGASIEEGATRRSARPWFLADVQHCVDGGSERASAQPARAGAAALRGRRGAGGQGVESEGAGGDDRALDRGGRGSERGRLDGGDAAASRGADALRGGGGGAARGRGRSAAQDGQGVDGGAAGASGDGTRRQRLGGGQGAAGADREAPRRQAAPAILIRR